MKRLAWALAGVLMISAALAGTAIWLTGTTSGLRLVMRAVSALSPYRLSFEAVEGDLSGTLMIGKLRLSNAQKNIEIDGLRLQWQPRALWQQRLEIDLLAAQSLRVTILKPDPAPPILPSSLRLPLDLRLHVLDLARLDINTAGPTFSFRNLRAGLDGTGDRYRLTQASVSTPWAELRGGIELGKDAPFALQGRVDAVRQEPLPVQAVLALSGALSAPEFKIDAAAAGMQFLAQGVAAPFARVQLTRLMLAGQGIDPRQFSVDAPQADLAFSGVFEGKLGGKLEGKPDPAQAGERLLGTFSLSNRLAGRIDQQRLPLANMTGAVLGDSASAEFSSLMLDLGAAGRLNGDGYWRDGKVTLNLLGPQLNLAGLHSALNPTRIEANLQFVGDAARQQLGGKFSESWGAGHFSASHDAAALHLEALEFSGQAGRLSAKGNLQLDAQRAFSAEFDAAQINPARIGKFPVARLNARGQVSGALLPTLRLSGDFTLPSGALEGRPVNGRGRFSYANQHLDHADIDLDLAGNLLRLQGAYGKLGDRLSWVVKAPALARLNLGLAGALNSNGTFSGNPAQPQVEAQLAASNLRLPGGVSASSLNLKLNLQASDSGAFNGELDGRGIELAGQHLTQLQARAQGRRDAHNLTLNATLPDARLSASLQGGFDAKQVWRGQLTRAEVQGAWPMHLIAPAGLLLSRELQQVENLALTLAGGSLRLAQLRRQGTQLATRGTLENLPLAPLARLLGEALPVSTDLRCNGDWNLQLGDSVDGQVHLSRVSGDVRLHDPAMNFGLTRLLLTLKAEAGQLGASLVADSLEAGKLRADGRASLLREGAGFSLPRAAPLAWNAQFELPDLRLAKPFLPFGMRADARVDAQLVGSGSLAAPRVSGQIHASRIRFAMPEEGIAIVDGVLKLKLAEDRVLVQEGVLIGSSGRVLLGGEAQWQNPQAGLTLNFEKFAASNRSDRRVIVSGIARLNLDRQRMQLGGELTADRARLEMPETGRPALGADVIVVGRTPHAAAASRRLPLALDLKLNLGKDFLFKGAGLDARLGGQLRVYTVNDAMVNDVMRGEGSIRVEEGRYAAYAQSLNIERGVLRFVGPLDNPGLDVLAVRKTAAVKAGVQVRGTVQRPVITLYSDPAMTDSEKLAWLVLGHGLDSGVGQEFALLQIAAGALLSQAESVNVQSQIAEALRIDNFEVRGGEGADLSSAVVSVGKRLSSRAMLSYEQSLDGLSQVVKVLYQLSPRVRLEAQAGQQSSFDAFYSVEYD